MSGTSDCCAGSEPAIRSEARTTFSRVSAISHVKRERNNAFSCRLFGHSPVETTLSPEACVAASSISSVTKALWDVILEHIPLSDILITQRICRKLTGAFEPHTETGICGIKQ
jgi:hypothetical protein